MLSKFDFASPILSKLSRHQDRTYELINELTEQADNGWSQSVKFYGQNRSDVNEYIDVDGEGRELHCELSLETKGLLDNQDMFMGVLFSKIDEDGDSFDGLMVHFNYQHTNAEATDITLGDVFTDKIPDVWNLGHSEIHLDNIQDWEL